MEKQANSLNINKKQDILLVELVHVVSESRGKEQHFLQRKCLLAEQALSLLLIGREGCQSALMMIYM
jgi:hypothetical protein